MNKMIAESLGVSFSAAGRSFEIYALKGEYRGRMDSDAACAALGQSARSGGEWFRGYGKKAETYFSAPLGQLSGDLALKEGDPVSIAKLGQNGSFFLATNPQSDAFRYYREAISPDLIYAFEGLGLIATLFIGLQLKWAATSFPRTATFNETLWKLREAHWL